MTTERERAAAELRRLLNTNCTDGASLQLLYIHEERHCHKDGTVTVRRWCSKREKPRRRRRDNHGMRRALVRQRKGA